MLVNVKKQPVDVCPPPMYSTLTLSAETLNEGGGAAQSWSTRSGSRCTRAAIGVLHPVQHALGCWVKKQDGCSGGRGGRGKGGAFSRCTAPQKATQRRPATMRLSHRRRAPLAGRSALKTRGIAFFRIRRPPTPLFSSDPHTLTRMDGWMDGWPLMRGGGGQFTTNESACRSL